MIQAMVKGSLSLGPLQSSHNNHQHSPNYGEQGHICSCDAYFEFWVPGLNHRSYVIPPGKVPVKAN